MKTLSHYPKPIPPKSVVRLAAADKSTPEWKQDVGRLFRVGYYSKNDGTDCVWLVNEKGEYEQATDHEYLFRYFDIIQLSDERSLFGRNKPPIAPVKAATRRSARTEQS